MSRSRVERVERVERERLSGRRRVNVARVITPPPLSLSLSLFFSRWPSRSLTVSFPFSHSPLLSICLSVSPFVLLHPVVPLSHARTRAALSRLRYYSLLSPVSSLSPRLASRLPLGADYSTRPLRELYLPKFFPPTPILSLCAHVYRCKPLSISRA